MRLIGYASFSAIALTCLSEQKKTKPEELLLRKGLAPEWSALTDAALKAEALEDIRSRWQEKERDWWDNLPGRSAKQARAIYDE